MDPRYGYFKEILECSNQSRNTIEMDARETIKQRKAVLVGQRQMRDWTQHWFALRYSSMNGNLNEVFEDKSRNKAWLFLEKYINRWREYMNTRDNWWISCMSSGDILTLSEHLQRIDANFSYLEVSCSVERYGKFSLLAKNNNPNEIIVFPSV